MCHETARQRGPRAWLGTGVCRRAEALYSRRPAHVMAYTGTRRVRMLAALFMASVRFAVQCNVVRNGSHGILF